MVDVGGTSFSPTKRIIVGDGNDDDDDGPTTTTMGNNPKTNDGNVTTSNSTNIVLVARGKSFLSYFYVGVCSSVLYLPPGTSNDVVLRFGEDDDDDHDDDDIANLTAVALDIHYHKPARAIDLVWATNKFIESNLPNGTTIANLSDDVRRQIGKFSDLYRNVRSGDRYSLVYIHGIGLRLSLNDELLGTVGADMRPKKQRELARIIYSVWFGAEAPFSASMRNDLLTPLEIPMERRHSPPPPLISDVTARIISTTSANDGMTAVSLGNSNAVLATSGRNTPGEGLSDEEITLLESMGILESMIDEGTGSSPRTTHPPDDDRSSRKTTSFDNLSEKNAFNDATTYTPSTFPTLSGIRRFLFRRENTTATNAVEDAGPDTDAKLGTTTVSTFRQAIDEANDDTSYRSRYNPIILGIGGALFLFPHLAVLLSLPSVLMRRGAPYLPTFGDKMNRMFDMVRHHVTNSEYMQRKLASRTLRFVDLGSGDGRVVFRAAREGMFVRSVGYEINPALHVFANIRRLITPGYWHTTRFHMSDLWKTTLNEYDVVAVYGLSPIMHRLGNKLERELRPGSIVVSNVFEIPGWKASDVGGIKNSGVFLYNVPDCFRGRSES